MTIQIFLWSLSQSQQMNLYVTMVIHLFYLNGCNKVEEV